MIKIILKYLLGGLFLFSAITKLIDYNSTVELFESLLMTNPITTKLFLFILIIMELIIAYMIIENYFENDFVFKTIVKLISIFLLINVVFAVKGYSNCGCFGSNIISSPIVSLGKNLFLLIGLYFLKRKKELPQKEIGAMK